MFLLVGGASIAFIAFTSSPPGQEGAFYSPLMQAIYTPLHKASSGIKGQIANFTSIFSNKKTLYAQIDDLQQRLDALEFENQSLREYRAESMRLQNLLNFKNANMDTLQVKAARVIARSPSNWYKRILVDQGSMAGIAVGMPVISPEGLVGRVASVTQNSAQVDLITDPEMAVGAILEKSRETSGIVEGHNDSLRMIDIPYYSKIEIYDLVVTSDLSAIYPKGIRIGTVTDIKKEQGGLLINATLSPAVNFDALEEVLVITSYRPLPEAKVEVKR